jgi:hypothetical protein
VTYQTLNGNFLTGALRKVLAMYEQAKEIILTKADCWQYEDEFRLIASPELPIDNPLRLHDDKYVRLPSQALTSCVALRAALPRGEGGV